MRRFSILILAAGSLLALAGAADAGIFLRGSAGWLEGAVYDTPEKGSIFLGGAGGSIELGYGFGRWAVSAEVGPSYSQPRRVIPESVGFEDGRERLLLANLSFLMEPIESLEPYLTIGGGQGVFTFDYGPAGREIRPGYRVQEETLKGWIGSGGLGFESPLFSSLRWGLRGRFLYHRWQAATNEGRFLPVSSGNGYLLDATLKVQF